MHLLHHSLYKSVAESECHCGEFVPYGAVEVGVIVAGVAGFGGKNFVVGHAVFAYWTENV